MNAKNGATVVMIGGLSGVWTLCAVCLPFIPNLFYTAIPSGLIYALCWHLLSTDNGGVRT